MIIITEIGHKLHFNHDFNHNVICNIEAVFQLGLCLIICASIINFIFKNNRALFEKEIRWNNINVGMMGSV